MKSESEVAQSCAFLSDPMNYSLPGSSVHGIFQARVLEWGAIAFSHNDVRIGEKPDGRGNPDIRICTSALLQLRLEG